MAQEEFDFGGEALPVGGEEAALKRVRALSKLLDDAFRVPGTDFRIGLDPIVSSLPVAGDSAMALVSLYIVLEAVNLGVPRSVVYRMILNIAIDTVGGSVPILGSVFDAAWKANRRNLKLIEQHAQSV